MRIGLIIAGVIFIFLGGGLALWSSNYTIICNGNAGQIASFFDASVHSECGLFNFLLMLSYGFLGIGILLLTFGFGIPDKKGHKRYREYDEDEHSSSKHNPRYCEECGHKLNGYERYCHECGHRIG
jgi:hypothetical protein